ncbi:SPOR domain-containing protein [Polymorphum gilvum]|uniref:SPOR domain-containing protein n=1 Tax=Polymorphum gilvum (strain LMG 25793 / CGMCC 1.9160 / SL003B-26A1) TaxID=991905 RepID=F2J0R9_POLGS|nr:SPOR domain-containing protein [Polymorphum gilvum]ADZ70755.1 hypothetical protein SL003B_2330 [Polymorphum gilvum SL003B-26A1]
MRNRQQSDRRNDKTDAVSRARFSAAAWAFAAILCAVVGLSAVRFAPGPGSVADRLAGIVLPPQGPVGATGTISTGTIATDGETLSVGILPSAGGVANAEANRLLESQIDTLRLEIVALRRRLSVLAEQNRAYSDRLAALEAGRPIPLPDDAFQAPAGGGNPDAVTPVPAPAPSSVETLPAPETSSRSARIARPEPPVPPPAPVRIVELPRPDRAPETTGSIDPAAIGAGPAPSADQARDLATDLAKDLARIPDENLPLVIRPLDPAGRIQGGAGSVGRTDFAIEIGTYHGLADAGAAWSEFEARFGDRMAGLRALVAPVEGDGARLRLLAGPFANAAGAAVACLRLSADARPCRPAFFLGDPLPPDDPAETVSR